MLSSFPSCHRFRAVSCTPLAFSLISLLGCCLRIFPWSFRNVWVFFKSLLDEDAVSTAAARLGQHTGTSAGHTELSVRSSASQCHLGKSWTIHLPLLFPYSSKPLVNSRHTGECRGKNYMLCEFKDINYILSAGSYDV